MALSSFQTSYLPSSVHLCLSNCLTLELWMDLDNPWTACTQCMDPYFEQAIHGLSPQSKD